MKKFDYEIVKDPKINLENCLPAHSDHVCMPNWFEGEYNSFRMSLDGLWKFSYAKNMELAVVGFEEKEYSCKGWDEDCVPTYIPIEDYDVNPVASYVKYFTLPVNMRGERVCISFQGVEGGFAVWLNGNYVGYSENAMEPTEFELTPFLQDGENKLAVRVWKWTAGCGNEDHEDSLVFGIFRSVYLYMVPETHLWDVQIIPELSEDLSEATLTIITTSCGKGEVEIRLLDDAMQEVLAGVMALEEGEEGSDAIQSGIAGMVYEPKLWSAEEPNLYILQLEVRDEYGDLTEVTSQYVGFRRFEMQDGVRILNGKPITFKGINKYAFNADTECVLNREETVKDIVTMKQNNINAVCTSSYLDDSDTYELCDEYGLYMIVENILDEENRWYQSYKNHPCIMMLSEEADIYYETGCGSLAKLQEIKYNYQNITVGFAEKTFTVSNKHSFINTDIYAASVILQKDGQSIAKVALPISVEPLEQKCFDIPQQILDIMDNIKIANAVHDGEMPEFAITVSFALPEDNLWAKRGHEVAFGQYVYKKEVVSYGCKEPFEVIKGRNNVLVKGNHFKALFSNSNAGFASYVYGGVEMFKQAPLPNFWRVPMDQHYVQWKIASMYATVKNQEIEELEHSVKLIYTFSMPTNPASGCKIIYHVFGDGTIETTMEYDLVEGLCDMPEFGMLFKMDAEFNRLKWYGLGPEDSYADSMCGAKLGIYENKVVDNMSKHIVPQECRNKCGVRYAEITNDKGRGMRFFGDELNFGAMPYTPHELENAVHIDELPGLHNTVVRVAQQPMGDSFKKKVFTFCFRGV